MPVVHKVVTRPGPFGGTLRTSLCGRLRAGNEMNVGEGVEVTCKFCLKSRRRAAPPLNPQEIDVDYWSFDSTSTKAHCGRCREFKTPGEARSYERGYYDGKCHAPMIEPWESYRTGWYDAESEELDKQDYEMEAVYETDRT